MGKSNLKIGDFSYTHAVESVSMSTVNAQHFREIDEDIQRIRCDVTTFAPKVTKWKKADNRFLIPAITHTLTAAGAVSNLGPNPSTSYQVFVLILGAAAVAFLTLFWASFVNYEVISDNRGTIAERILRDLDSIVTRCRNMPHSEQVPSVPVERPPSSATAEKRN